LTLFRCKLYKADKELGDTRVFQRTAAAFASRDERQTKGNEQEKGDNEAKEAQSKMI
jgi:hypothetical protein